MRRFAIATLAGFALLAGQAAAANQGPDLRVGDRVGPTKGATKRFAASVAGPAGFAFFQSPMATAATVGAAIGAGVLIYRATKRDSSP